MRNCYCFPKILQKFNTPSISLAKAISEEVQLNILSADMKRYWSIYPPSKLHDGYLNNFAHSYPESDGMWVRVYLKERVHVTKILVYNRASCCQDRIVGPSVLIKSGNEYVTNCGGLNSARMSYELHCSGEGDVVEISQAGAVGEWNLAEIRVYGKPIIGPKPGYLSKMLYRETG